MQEQELEYHWCFVTWATYNSRVSERMIEFLPPEYIEGLDPIVFGYDSQLKVSELIIEAVKRYELHIHTLQVLPDHVHMLVKVESEKELEVKIGNVKGFTAHEIRRQTGTQTKVWATKFHCEWVEDEKHFQNVVRYIDKNHLKHVGSWGKDFLSGYGPEIKDILKSLRLGSA